MKRLALVAALGVLTACTTFHEDRRTLTSWNLDLIKETARGRPSAKDKNDWDSASSPVMNWVLVEPIYVVMLPFSWLGDTLIVNPINGWEKAEVQVYNRRFSHDDERGTSEAALRSEQVLPGVLPWFIGDLLALPEFAGHWIWNSTYWTAPIKKDDWNRYWNEHHETSTQ